jgi:hypothetical protein
MRGEAGQGLATFLEGVRKLGKTVTGQEDVSIPGKTVKDEMIRSGMSEKEIEFAKNFYGFDLDAPATEPLWKPLLKGAGDVAGGAIQTLGAPITGVIGADVPVVSPITEAAATIGTAPAWIPTKIIANVIDAAARQGGANVESEEYKESVRKPIENILNVFYGRKIPEIAEVVREGTGKIRSFAGKRLKEAGVSVGETVLPTTAKEAELMQKFEAGQLPFKPRTVGETAIERGVTGTQTKIGTKAVKTGVEIFEKEVNPALEASKEIITKKELFSPLEEKVAKTVEPGRKAELSDALEAIKEEYASPEFDNIGLPKAQKIKSGLDEFTPQKSFRGKEIGSAYNQLRNDMADVIRRLTYDKLKDINIKNKYIDYSNLKELEKLGIKARTQKGGAFKPGGTGTLIRDLWDMVTIPAGTIGGRLLYKVGEFLELQSNKPVKTVGEYIKSQGVSKKEFEQQLKPPPVFKTGEIP